MLVKNSLAAIHPSPKGKGFLARQVNNSRPVVVNNSGLDLVTGMMIGSALRPAYGVDVVEEVVDPGYGYGSSYGGGVVEEVVEAPVYEEPAPVYEAPDAGSSSWGSTDTSSDSGTSSWEGSSDSGTSDYGGSSDSGTSDWGDSGGGDSSW